MALPQIPSKNEVTMADPKVVFSPRANAVNTQGLQQSLHGVTTRVGSGNSRNGSTLQDDDSFHSAYSTDEDSVSLEHETMAANTNHNVASPSSNIEFDNNDGHVAFDTRLDDGSDDGSSINDPPARAILNMDGKEKEAAMEEGYDSDGEPPPKNSTMMEESALEEEALGETPPAVVVAGADNTDDNDEVDCAIEEPPNTPVPMTDSEMKKLKVTQIKEQLAIRNVSYPARLKRPELLERLKRSLHLPVVGVIGGKKK